MAATNDHATARLRQRKSIDVCLSEIRPNFGHEFDSPKLFLRGLEKRVRYSDVKNFFAEFIFPDTRSRLDTRSSSADFEVIAQPVMRSARGYYSSPDRGKPSG
jgi:hypothetical protein